METIEATTSNTPGFIQHVFNFDNSTKSELMNIAQYSLFCIIPIILLNKGLAKLFPNVSDEKGTVELTIEVVGEIFVILFAMYFIHRIITFVKPYSGENYPEFNILNSILVLLVVVLSFQTQLAEKVNLLTERLVELWTGVPNTKDNKEVKNNVTVSQPLSVNMPIPTHQNSRADYLGSHNQMLPNNNNNSVNMSNAVYQDSLAPQQAPQQAHQQAPQSPNFNNMFQEPMAANEAIGGFASF